MVISNCFVVIGDRKLITSNYLQKKPSLYSQFYFHRYVQAFCEVYTTLRIYYIWIIFNLKSFQGSCHQWLANEFLLKNNFVEKRMVLKNSKKSLKKVVIWKSYDFCFINYVTKIMCENEKIIHRHRSIPGIFKKEIFIFFLIL